MSMHYDDIIIGAGSSGSVIAARLSEDSSRKVLLIEAGKGFDFNNMPLPLANPKKPVTSGFNWDLSSKTRNQSTLGTLQEATRMFGAASGNSKLSMLKTAIQGTAKGDALLTRFDYPVGKGVGGSSSINGGLAIRGSIHDFNEWVALGLPMWNWPTVLKLFKALENDLDLTGPYYGNSGPLPVSRCSEKELHPVQQRFYDTCVALGYGRGELNNPKSTGVSLVPHNVQNGIRVSTAIAYLKDALERDNLTLAVKSLTDTIEIDNAGKANVNVVQDGTPKTYTSDRVIIAAGAINSPQILMRSGYGPEQQLKSHDIKTRINLPGVGENLSDHPAVGIWMIPQQGLCHIDEDIHQVMLRYTSSNSKSPNDMALFMLNSVETDQFPELKTALGVPLAMAVSSMLGKPDSRGKLTLGGKKLTDRPNIMLNICSAESDVQRLMEGVRKSWQIIHEQQFKGSYSRIFAWNSRILESDTLLAETISTFVRGSWHATGTAKMGVDTDPMAVVDERGKVFGTDNIYVADASIMPTITTSPPNQTCIMMGEMLSRCLMEN